MGLVDRAMMHTREIGGVVYVWREPSTALEVLEWEVRVQAHQSHPRTFIQRAAAWVAQYVDAKATELYELGAKDSDGMGNLILLCTCVAKSAQLPADYLEGLRTLWARDADVEDVEPEPWCDCPRCSGANPDAPESVCKFTGISPGVLSSAGKLLGIDEAGAILSAPYWFLQIQAERARIRGRKYAQADQKKKDVADTVSMWDEANPNWRTTPRLSTKVH